MAFSINSFSLGLATGAAGVGLNAFSSTAGSGSYFTLIVPCVTQRCAISCATGAAGLGSGAGCIVPSMASSPTGYFLSLIDCPLLCEVCSISDLTGNQAARLLSHRGSIDSYSFFHLTLTNASCGAGAVIFSPSVGRVTEAVLMSSLNNLTAASTDIVIAQLMSGIAFADQSVSQDVIILVGSGHMSHFQKDSVGNKHVVNRRWIHQVSISSIFRTMQFCSGACYRINQFSIDIVLGCNRIIDV